MGRSWISVGVVVAGCSFHGAGTGIAPDDAAGPGSGSGSGSGSDAAVLDGPPDAPHVFMDGPCWPYAPSNIDPCNLPALSDLTGLISSGSTFNTDSPPGGVHTTTITQANGVGLLVVHVASLTVPASKAIGVTGAKALALVSDGAVIISGSVQTGAAADLACTGADGHDAPASPDLTTSSGGGGGGAGALDGGGGGTGSGTQTGGAGSGGGHITGATMLAPLRGGCSGGRGGTYAVVGGSAGGGAGGALQITAAGSITIADTGAVLAVGFGGAGGIQAHGGGGGGGGGAILLEGTGLSIAMDGIVCADGGSGGQGGSGTQPVTGTDGSQGACIPAGGAVTPPRGGAGGDGGNGGAHANGPTGGGTAGSSGGGGGGGAAGWIRFHVVGSIPSQSPQAIVTPDPVVN